MAKRQPAATPPEQPRPKRPPPEMKFSVGGIGVAVWLNTVDTDQGKCPSLIQNNRGLTSGSTNDSCGRGPV